MEKKVVEVKKENVAAQPEQTRKLTYEQLENVCHQLSEQARTLYQQLQEAELTNLFRRLDYLFKVVEHYNSFPQEFAAKCIDEIVAAMTMPEETKKAEE